jgi:hypothetical protein
MKRTVLAFLGLLALIASAQAQARAPETSPPPPPAPPPIYQAVTVPAANLPVSVYVYDQKPVGGRPYLIAPEQAQSIINRFKDEYKKLGSPRFIIYINRELMVSTNIYSIRDAKEAPLPDRQTARDLERLFGRPLRMAGVHLADQSVASQLFASRSLDRLTAGGDQADRDREALGKVADVVLEILVSSKDMPVAELSEDRIYSVPDIQATAIRLSDAKILGQATAADLIGQGPGAGQAVRTLGIREIAEATALSLMEDTMLQ